MNYANTLARYIGITYSLQSKRLNELLEENEVGITTDQFRLMTHLWKQDGVPQQNLACNLSRDRASVTRMVDILENEGFITRIPDKADRRVNLIYLTKRGKELEIKAAACAQRCLDEMTKNLSKEEQHTLSALLQKVMKNFGE
jgi:DNA-binding MarR family transcriptional regulator